MNPRLVWMQRCWLLANTDALYVSVKDTEIQALEQEKLNLDKTGNWNEENAISAQIVAFRRTH